MLAARLWIGREGNEAAGVHCAGNSCCVACLCACAATRADAAHRRARGRGECRRRRHALTNSNSRCSGWAGPTAATFKSTSAGPWAMPNSAANTRRNWSHSVRMSSSPLAARTWGRCTKRRARSRSYSRSFPIQSVPASSTVWRSRAATPPAFMQFEYSLAGKWLELLKQIAPDVTRAAVLWDPAIPTAIGQFAVIQAVAPVTWDRVKFRQCAQHGRDRS